MYQLLKRGRNPFNSYGALILATILTTALWVAWDTQAASRNPGWFAAQRSSDVWCHSQIRNAGDQPGNFTLVSHYPTKEWKRVVEDLNAPPSLEAQLLEGERTTECFATFREAALEHPFFVEITKGYEDIIIGWSEANFERSLKALAFAKGGKEMLEAALYRQAEELRKGTTQQ